MEEVFKHGSLSLSALIEAVAGLIIGFAAVEALFRLFLLRFRGQFSERVKDQTRLRLGRWLALALEFELAADIVRTAVAPTWNEIGQLAAIIVLRTVLNFFLQKEIEKADQGIETEGTRT